MPPLYITIPAQLQGRPFGLGTSGAAQLRNLCSWRGAGFVPVSVNTAEEHNRHPAFSDALTRAEVASIVVAEHPQRVLCSIRGFLKAIGNHTPCGPVAITNADICLAGGPDLANAVETLSPSRFLLGQRTDFPFPSTEHDPTPHGAGIVNLHGFDFFACDAAALTASAPFLSEKLALGLPFWDHLLPLALMASGHRALFFNPGCIRHATHPIRWSTREYCALGLASARHLADALAKNPAAARACDWLPIHDRILDPKCALNRFDGLLRRLIQTGWAPSRLTLPKIGRLAGANFAFLLYAMIRESQAGIDPLTETPTTEVAVHAKAIFSHPAVKIACE